MISRFKPQFKGGKGNSPAKRPFPLSDQLTGQGNLNDINILVNSFEYEVGDTDGLTTPGGFLFNGVGSPSATTANVANTLLFTPFIVRQSVWVDQLMFATSTGTNGSVVMGIYDTKDNKPFKKIAQTTAVGTTADNTLYTTTLSSKVLLKPGVYWVARNATSNKLLQGFTAGNASLTLGAVPTDLASFNTLTQRTGYSISSTYNAELPSIAPDVTTTITTSIPALGMRVQGIVRPTGGYGLG